MRKILGIATALAVIAWTDALAAEMTRSEYKAREGHILAAYEADRQKCGAGIGDGVDLCVAKARAARKVASAELEAAYKPSLATNYDAAIARAQAAYSITNEECNDKDAMTRKVCERVAKAALERAEAEAMAAMKTAGR
jgi:hypothetical protein